MATVFTPNNFYTKYRNTGFEMNAVNYWTGLLAHNDQSTGTYFADADGVVRRGMAGYVKVTGTTAATTSGIPTVKYLDTSGNEIKAANSSTPSPMQNRPWVLNRPFHSVVEMGYAFSDTPWRSVNFFTPESEFAGLLEVFGVADKSNNGSPMVAGKVDLNTSQINPIKGVAQSAYKNAQNTAGTVISATDAQSIAGGTRVGSEGVTKTSGTMPFTNLSDMVGVWKGGSTGGGTVVSGSSAFYGQGGKMSGMFNDDLSKYVQRYQESAFRTLANNGSTRVWNLMIDVIAQTGRYPTTAKTLGNFVVDGEQRYWLHIALDRLTGEVLDRSLEVVRE